MPPKIPVRDLKLGYVGVERYLINTITVPVEKEANMDTFYVDNNYCKNIVKITEYVHLSPDINK